MSNAALTLKMSFIHLNSVLSSRIVFIVYISVNVLIFFFAVFKIVRLSQGKLESKMSLRDLPPRKTVNLNFSTLHIQWKPGSGEGLV